MYPESFLAMLSVVQAYLLPIRQLERFTRMLTKHVDRSDTPDFTSIAWKVAKMNIKINPTIMEEAVIVIAAGSSSIKVENRGEWIRKKWYVRGFIKMLTAVGKESKEIVVKKVPRNVPDGKKIIPLMGVEEWYCDQNDTR